MKLRGIELMRGLAALSVVLAHISGTLWAGRSTVFPGGPGVEFFFVLSGFVMMLVHGGDFGHAGRVPAFLWKRFCRIYPLYWIILAVLVMQNLGGGDITPTHLITWISLSPVTNINWQTWLVARGQDLLPVAWTLRHEVTFYLMFALALLPYAGVPILAAWLLGTILLAAGAHILSTNFYLALVQVALFSPFTFEFMAGLAAGYAYRRWHLPRRAAQAVLAAGIALLLWRLGQDGWGMRYGPAIARPIYGAAYGAIILGCSSLERDRALELRLGRWALVAGALSYPLYLSHMPIVGALRPLLGWAGRAEGPLLLAGTLAAAFLLAALIDRPVQRLLRGHGWPPRRLRETGAPVLPATRTPGPRPSPG
ncbi:MAG TPA: acyltransferase [Acetobacteraceae bacterium]|nr:acyltransferase [Acetobacteraceae bacterium]